MRIDRAEGRLHSLWGAIDAQHNRLIAARLRGRRILDVGCGFGSLVDHLRRQGLDAQGWDHEAEMVRLAGETFPGAPISRVDVECPSAAGEAPGARFDSVVLNSTLHHLVGEGDVFSALATIRRLLTPGGRLVVLDPNPIWPLRVARRVIGHRDPEASPRLARSLLEEQGFTVRGIDFYETVGLPLSGGYVNVQLLPGWPPVRAMVCWLNHALSRLLCRLGLGSRLCLRYLIWADRAEVGGE